MKKFLVLIVTICTSVAVIFGPVNTARAADATPDLGIGVGVGEFVFTSSRDIKGATIDQNGFVRVTEIHRREASIWLEAHSMFLLSGFTGIDLYGGPWLGLQAGSTQGIFDSMAGGLMLAVKRPDPDGKMGNQALAVGVGLGYTQVNRLGAGFVENQAAPTGAKEVLMRKQDELGPVFMMSFHFF
jgi:hypothetical protein